MKLYCVKKNSYVRVQGEGRHPPSHRDFKEKEVLVFKHIDGMYSYCEDLEGKPVHLVAWAEVEVLTKKELEEM